MPLDSVRKFIDEEEDLERELSSLDEEPDIPSPREEEPAPASKEEEEISVWAYALDLLLSIIIIFGAAWFIRMMVVSPFYVEGESMVPTMENSDFLVVNKFSYHFDNPERGDVVIFRPPNQEGVFYVKRVIGLPGETIEFVNGEVMIKNDEHPEGWRIEEDYLNEENEGRTYLPTRKDRRVYIPEGYYFMVGDNRNHSSDSRTWLSMNLENGGAIPRKMIVGRAEVRIWIPEKIWWKIGIPHLALIPDTVYEK